MVVLLKVQHFVEESPNSLHRGHTEGQRQASPPRFEAPRPSSNRVSGLGKLKLAYQEFENPFTFFYFRHALDSYNIYALTNFRFESYSVKFLDTIE